MEIENLLNFQEQNQTGIFSDEEIRIIIKNQ